MGWLNNFSRRKPIISIWHNFRQPPWGGGNQFMLALSRELKLTKDIVIKENYMGCDVKAYILHSIWFDLEVFRKRPIGNSSTQIIHRLDGVMAMYRGDGTGKDKDELCFSINNELATVSVVQSQYILDRIYEWGYKPVNPVIIPNACDPAIFNTHGRVPFSRNRKIRLIAVSWSKGLNKGADVYEWLEKNLDWSRFDFTFVGNAPLSFQKINQISPVPSEQLANILREHDIYITASRKEACSNALIEALSCGLPPLYITDSSHHEFVKAGGLPFNTREEIIPQLEALISNYEEIQSKISPPDIKDIAIRYSKLVPSIFPDADEKRRK